MLDRAPEFLLPSVKGVPATFYERYCGRPAAVVLAHGPALAHCYDAVARTAGLYLVTAEGGSLPGAAHLASAFGETLPGPDAPAIVLLFRPTLQCAARLVGPRVEEVIASLAELAGVRHVLLSFMWGDEVSRL